jgi:hypothetical protein
LTGGFSETKPRITGVLSSCKGNTSPIWCFPEFSGADVRFIETILLLSALSPVLLRRMPWRQGYLDPGYSSDFNKSCIYNGGVRNNHSQNKEKQT